MCRDTLLVAGWPPGPPGEAASARPDGPGESCLCLRGAQAGSVTKNRRRHDRDDRHGHRVRGGSVLSSRDVSPGSQPCGPSSQPSPPRPSRTDLAGLGTQPPPRSRHDRPYAPSRGRGKQTPPRLSPRRQATAIELGSRLTTGPRGSLQPSPRTPCGTSCHPRAGSPAACSVRCRRSRRYGDHAAAASP